MQTWRRSALLLAAFFSAGMMSSVTGATGSAARANGEGLAVTVGVTGLTTLRYKGVDFLSNGDLIVQKATLTNAQGVRVDASTTPVPTPTVQDSRENTIKRVYPWGVVRCAYMATGDRLNMTISVQNTSSSTLTGLYIQPIELRFPDEPQGWVKDYAYLGANRGDPTVEYANFGSGALAVCNDDVDRALLVGFPGRASLTVRPVWVCTANIPGYLSPYLDPYIKRPIAPHATDTFHISLRFGPPEAREADLAGDLYRKIAAAWPLLLHWDDRRAIGTLHLAASETQLHSPANPRGWFADPTGIDITTPAGIDAFHRRILKYADDSVAVLKKMNAQGMITWDIEGEEYPQATTYIGDPRLEKELAPEMDTIADAYFRKFRDAGIRTGLCIRPQQLRHTPAKTDQEEVMGGPEPIAALLFDKIRYANKRWGCTIFYVDSNGDPNVPYDPAIFEILRKRLAREKITALVMPEHRNLRYYAYTAPYASLAHNIIGTPGTVRLAYPHAFLANYVPDQPIGGDRAALVRAVRGGDILLFRAWWDDPVNAEVKGIYDEAKGVVEAGCFAGAFPLPDPRAEGHGSMRGTGTEEKQPPYKTPTITLPYAWKKPTLDGVIRDEEWQEATSFSALQTTDHKVSPRQTRFWMMWDTDNIYVAMRSPLRPGERPIQALRDRGKDVNAVFDDAYEIWIDVGSHSPDGQPVFFQYLGNFAGARSDVMQEPAAGNSRPGWTSHWNPQNRLSADGRNWEMTVAIPRATIYKGDPFADGFAFEALLARDYKRPWDQDSISGAGSYSVRETYAHFVLSRDAPAMHLLAVGDPQSRTFGLRMSAWSKIDRTLRCEFSGDGGVGKTADLHLAAGQLTALPTTAGLDSLDKPGEGNFRVTILNAGSTNPMFDWSARRQWGDLNALTQKIADTGDQVDLTLSYNPARDYLRATGDFINYDARATIARYHVDVRDASNRTLAAEDLKLDPLAYVRGLIALPDLMPGSYTARLTASDSSGHLLFTRENRFEKKDPAKSFAWWNTSLGNIEKVIAPWTPVRYASGQLSVWGREMRIGPAGLPRQITSQGTDLLAAAATLEATLGDGRTVRAEGGSPPVTVSAADHRVVVRTTSRLGDIAVQSVVTTEFDGMYRIEMTLIPTKPTAVGSLTLTVPLHNGIADYLHACGEGIRYGFDDRSLPRDKSGSLWDSRAVDGQPMVVGSFIPYVWIGSPSAGLCWFADSDQGWVPSDTVPAIEVRRGSARSTDLILHLIGAPVTLTAPRTITFAFQATPVKPIQPGWRMDTWWTNDSFQDWAQVESQGHAGNIGLIFSSIPFPLDPAKSRAMVAARHQQTNATIFGFDKYRANAVPYFEHINMGEAFVPELTYFGDEWRTRVSRGLSYGKTLQDFMIYNLSHWVQSSDIDGFYVDNVFPIADDNIDSGHGYRLPDGQVQPAYQMFDTRRYFLRMRAAFAEQGKSGKIVLHMTNHLIAPWMGAADIALDGEHHVIYPEMGKDFMDFWSLERLRMDYPGQWGVAVNFLQEYQGDWNHDVLKKAMRACTGMLLLNDTLASANANSLNQEAWIARNRFGIEADNVRFHGYQDLQSGMQCDTPGIHVSGWTRPGTALLAVVNMDEATNAVVRIDAQKLGLPAPSKCRVRDAETLVPIPLQPDGTLTVPIERHDYRQIFIDSSASE